jgi:hypothetical protein
MILFVGRHGHLWARRETEMHGSGWAPVASNGAKKALTWGVCCVGLGPDGETP